MKWRAINNKIDEHSYTKADKPIIVPHGNKTKPLMTPTEWATFCRYRREFNK